MATRQTGATLLKQLMNLDDNAYMRNRLKYHAASRIGIQTGQALGQAMNTDGHNVQSSQVWTSPVSDFIVQSTVAMKTSTDGIATNVQLVTDFTATGTKVKDLANGEVWENENYPAVRLYKQCEMSAVAGSNGTGSKYEAYELLDGGNRIMDWIAPTSVKDNGLPVPGYTARIEGYKSSKWTDLQNCGDVSGNWALAQNNWEFVYMSGMCTFHPDTTPTQYSYTKLRITAFAYKGTYLSDTLSSMSQTTANNMMAIKPFIFSAAAMDSVNEGNDKQIQIPGIVFNVFDNRTGLAYGDLEYNYAGTNSYTVFTIEDYANSDIVFDVNGATQFTAMSFVLATGEPVPVLDPQTIPVYESSSSEEP